MKCIVCGGDHSIPKGLHCEFCGRDYNDEEFRDSVDYLDRKTVFEAVKKVTGGYPEYWRKA